MRTFKQNITEGKVTPALVKGLGFLLRNKLSQKIKTGKSSKDLSQKLDALLDAQGILGSGTYGIQVKSRASLSNSKDARQKFHTMTIL